ncbi:MAG: hypothetical protein RL757_2431 [Bacteroidota bacterium]
MPKLLRRIRIAMKSHHNMRCHIWSLTKLITIDLGNRPTRRMGKMKNKTIQDSIRKKGNKNWAELNFFKKS